MLESEMTASGVSFFEKQSLYKSIKQEVPFLSRCIDVVLLKDTDEIISIEFKINNWKHAIEQAKNHKLGADKAYICLPKRKLTESLSEAITNAKIGLLFFDSENEQIVEVIPAPEENGNIPVFKDMLLNNLNKL